MNLMKERVCEYENNCNGRPFKAFFHVGRLNIGNLDQGRVVNAFVICGSCFNRFKITSWPSQKSKWIEISLEELSVWEIMQS